MVHINTEFVKNTVVPGEYRDSILRGFILKVTQSGAKSFQVHGRVKGASNIRYTIGKFGSPWTVRDAKEEAQKILHLMKTGVDPRVEILERNKIQAEKLNQEKSSGLKKELTLKAVFTQWKDQEKLVKNSTKKLYGEVL